MSSAAASRSTRSPAFHDKSSVSPTLHITASSGLRLPKISGGPWPRFGTAGRAATEPRAGLPPVPAALERTTGGPKLAGEAEPGLTEQKTH